MVRNWRNSASWARSSIQWTNCWLDCFCRSAFVHWLGGLWPCQSLHLHQGRSWRLRYWSLRGTTSSGKGRDPPVDVVMMARTRRLAPANLSSSSGWLSSYIMYSCKKWTTCFNVSIKTAPQSAREWNYVSAEGHSGFEDGHLRSRETEFEPGADDASFDVTTARFADEHVVEVVLDADEWSWRNGSAQSPPHVFKIDGVLKVLLFQMGVVAAVFRLSFHNWISEIRVDFVTGQVDTSQIMYHHCQNLMDLNVKSGLLKFQMISD